MSAADLAAAEAKVQQQAKIQKQRPSWDDYVSAGVIEHVPEPGADGKISAKVSGHDKVVRMLQMNEAAMKVESEICDASFDEIPKAKIKGRGGETQYVPEHQAEARERKHFTPKTMITVPEMPWNKNR